MPTETCPWVSPESMLQADGVRWATKRLGTPVRSAPNTAEAVLTVKRSKPSQWRLSWGSNSTCPWVWFWSIHICMISDWTAGFCRNHMTTNLYCDWFICQNGNMSDKLRCTECMDFKYLAPSRSPESLHFPSNRHQAFKQLNTSICLEIGPSGSLKKPGNAWRLARLTPFILELLGRWWLQGGFWPIWFKRELKMTTRSPGWWGWTCLRLLRKRLPQLLHINTLFGVFPGRFRKSSSTKLCNSQSDLKMQFGNSHRCNYLLQLQFATSHSLFPSAISLHFLLCWRTEATALFT